MSRSEDPAAAIDALIRDLQQLIETKTKEVQELRTRLMNVQRVRNDILQAARVTGRSSAALPNIVSEPTPPVLGRTTLRDEVVAVLVRKGATSPSTALSAKEVADELDTQGRRGTASARGFYAMVYIALKRSADAGEISFEETAKGRRFYR